MAVVQPDVEGLVEHPLDEGAKVALLQPHEDCGDKARRLGEDVLREADDGDGASLAGRAELVQQWPHLEGLLPVALLVHVDELHVFPVAKGQAHVLVLRLALAQDRIAGQLDAALAHQAAAAVGAH